MLTKRGTIHSICGHRMSGLWQIVMEDGTVLHIESGYGTRQLAAAFGATEGTGDLINKIAGQEIYYTCDFMGILEAFTPVEEAKRKGLDVMFEDEVRKGEQEETNGA